MRSLRTALVGIVCVLGVVMGTGAAGAGGQKPKATVVKGSGDLAAAIAKYQALLGPDNGGDPIAHATGRRELNWDAVPDELALPNAYPSDFFNATVAPRARGAVITTPGDSLGVSADSDNPDGALPRFADINRSYLDDFQTYSPERLFSPIGSNVANITFFEPGTDTKAAVRGFGAVYTGVDSKGAADFEFYDTSDKLLGRYAVPKAKDGLSFLGVAFPDAIVGRVRIVYGNTALGPDNSKKYDVAVMDNFIYGEPHAIG